MDAAVRAVTLSGTQMLARFDAAELASMEGLLRKLLAGLELPE